MLEPVIKRFDVLVVGAGPAGLAAAASASESGDRVCILDDNPQIGGQIWRGESLNDWTGRLRNANVEIIPAAQAVHCDLQARILFVEASQSLLEIGFSKLILATGARERFLPFPGWTLPNVMGAGGLQAMVKSGLPIEGKRLIVAGTGPLLLAVAAYLNKHGARVQALCEQASWNTLARFATGLIREPGKIRQALQLRRELKGVPLWPNSWPVRALGRQALEYVTISRNGKTVELACDYLACGFHLVPNIEFASLIGCEIKHGFVFVNTLQETSVPGVFCAGEATAIGGLERSLLEGRIAGLAASGKIDQARALEPQKRHTQAFAARLARCFALRPELKSAPTPETIVCRCEDVTHARASQFKSWRDAKNQTRIGMGPCQGRVCGPVAHYLYNWTPDSIRPPIFPMKIENLAAIISNPGEHE